jgi:hypothetical protein
MLPGGRIRTRWSESELDRLPFRSEQVFEVKLGTNCGWHAVNRETRACPADRWQSRQGSSRQEDRPTRH